MFSKIHFRVGVRVRVEANPFFVGVWVCFSGTKQNIILLVSIYVIHHFATYKFVFYSFFYLFNKMLMLTNAFISFKLKVISFEIIIFIHNFLQKIGEEWITDLSKLRRLEKFVKDKNFKHAFMRSKQVIKKKNEFLGVSQLLVR